MSPPITPPIIAPALLFCRARLVGEVVGAGKNAVVRTSGSVGVGVSVGLSVGVDVGVDVGKALERTQRLSSTSAFLFVAQTPHATFHPSTHPPKMHGNGLHSFNSNPHLLRLYIHTLKLNLTQTLCILSLSSSSSASPLLLVYLHFRLGDSGGIASRWQIPSSTSESADHSLSSDVDISVSVSGEEALDTSVNAPALNLQDGTMKAFIEKSIHIMTVESRNSCMQRKSMS